MVYFSAFCSPHDTRVLWKAFTRYVILIYISCFIGEVRTQLSLDRHTSALRRREVMIVVDYISSAFHWRDIRVLPFAYLPQRRHIWWRMVNSVCRGAISPLGRTLGYLEQRWDIMGWLWRWCCWSRSVMLVYSWNAVLYVVKLKLASVWGLLFFSTL